MPIRDVDVDNADQLDQHRKQQKVADKKFQKVEKGFQTGALRRGFRGNGIFLTHSFSG
jgi:hypothetical protein